MTHTRAQTADLNHTVAEAELDRLYVELSEALAPGIQVLHRLGAGGMGVVYLGRDPLLKRQVAIKVLAPLLASDATARARFVREAEAAAAVAHPNVVAIHAVGELPRSGTPYFVMQYVSGRTLADELRSAAPLSEARARRILGEVASALAAAHARGLVHRDVKPANIMLDDETDRAMVLDFGISAVQSTRVQPTEERLTQQGVYLGTPTYMSPEQASGEDVTGRSDVYSLGVVAYETLTGTVPFTGSPIALMAAHIKDAPASVQVARPDVDAHVVHTVERCLSKAPDARPSAADVAQALLPSASAAVEWPPPGLEPMRGNGARLLRRLLVGLSFAVLFFVLLAAQPTLDAPRWVGGEQSPLWRAYLAPGAFVGGVPDERIVPRGGRFAVGFEPADSTSIWIALLGFAWCAMIVTGLSMAAPAWRLLRQMSAARRCGYPWSAIAAVVTDRWRDTPALLNATGPYALLGAPERANVLRLRRLQTLALVVAASSAAILPALWVTGRAGGWIHTADVLPVPELLVLLLPFLALAWAAVLVQLERRVRRPAVRRIARRPDTAIGARPELVQAWIRSAAATDTTPAAAEGSRSGASSRLRRARVPFAPIAGVILLVLAAASCTLIMLVVVRAAAQLRRARGEAAAWVAAQRAHDVDTVLTSAGVGLASIPPQRWSEIDSLTQVLAVPVRLTSPDIADARLLLAHDLPASAAPGGERLSSMLDADSASAASLDTMDARAGIPPASVEDFGRVFRAYSAFQRGPKQPLDDAMRQRFMRIAGSHWLDVWRRLAASPSLPGLWEYRPSRFATLASPFAVPAPRITGMKELSYRNYIAGYVAFDRGDYATAVQRARENIAVGNLLARGGSTLLDVLLGQVIVGSGRDLLYTAARAQGDAATMRDVTALRNATIRWRDERLSGAGWAALFADPGDPAGAPWLGAHSLAPVVRLSALTAVTEGFCFDAREILFGVDPQRRMLLQRADLRDLSAGDAMIALNARWLAAVSRADPAAMPPRDVSGLGTPVEVPRGGSRLLRWVGLDGVRQRLTFCRRIVQWM